MARATLSQGAETLRTTTTTTIITTGQRRPFPLRPLAAALLAASCLSPAQAQYSNEITLSGPSWQIALTDYGYSDYLGDLTPGFEGREYLSGEWGAAVGYAQAGNVRTPTWLEPNFVYPDWTTNSNFQVVSAITQGADKLKWYESSTRARRGFCPDCGSSIFKDNKDGEKIVLAVGALDAPTGLSFLKNIFVESKGDYYDLPGE